jgi:glycosyltransferase involved in cell wall biosynthesis
MHTRNLPSISAVLATYESEEWIAEAIDSILGQTRPPEEVVVVDDGSTDSTARILAGYGDRVRVISQANTGYPVAMNRAIRESTGDLVAPCGADDIWEPRKLEWQREAIAAHPEVGVFFGHAVFFGSIDADHVRPAGSGLLERQSLVRDLFWENVINMPTVVFDPRLLDRVGWFQDGFLADDFEFFFNCLRAEVDFFYDPRPLVRYRRHAHNITNSNLVLHEAMLQVRAENLDLLTDRGLGERALADDTFRVGRERLDHGDRAGARAAIRDSLRQASAKGLYWRARAHSWIAVLSLPDALGERVVGSLLRLRRALRGGSPRPADTSP